ncbi:MAG: endonuclease/exonuclease/phosphatase family protein [Anaerobacillus sp.]|uniref:endonuclease/exonuclease/phosphatase family protein n=1 Tax=Anaerobacillus sp. TaxID=1872506 RepID=UPI00391992D0
MKLLTLNCHSWQEEDQLNKIKILAATIKENDYDVIALQEVSQKIIAKKVDGQIKKDNFVYVLLNELKKLGVSTYTYVWAFSHIGFVFYEEGVAILTKHKIERSPSFFITESQSKYSWKTRNIIGITTHINEKPVSFYSCHLGWWNDEDEPFKAQVDKLMTFLPENEHIFLMGDFNNDAAVRNEGYDYLVGKGFYDTFQLANEKDRGITVPGQITGWAKNTDDLRLDYIFTNQPIAVQSSKVIFNGENKPVISDHYGVDLLIKEC